MQIPGRQVNLRQRLLVPLVRLRTSHHSPRELDGLTVVEGVLASSPVDAQEGARVPPLAIGARYGLTDPVLECAGLSEGHQSGVKGSRSHSVVRRGDPLTGVKGSRYVRRGPSDTN